MNTPPPPDIPGTINFSALVGSVASSEGGGLPQLNGSFSARIEGDNNNVFSVLSLGTPILVTDPPDPDLPPGSQGRTQSWQTIRLVSGQGPIDLTPAEAFVVTVGFTPHASTNGVPLTASVSLFEGPNGATQFQIPIFAIRTLPGFLSDPTQMAGLTLLRW